jgi:ADP-dependent NAD(P)H-hydrate dehydratase
VTQDYVRLTRELLLDLPLPQPGQDTDKDSRGRVLVAGGSATSAGGVTLSALAALRAGAGKVRLAVPESLAIPIAVSFPEAGVYPFSESAEGYPAASEAARQVAALLASVDAGLIGPGLMDEGSAQELAFDLLESTIGPHFVIDAMALTGLWGAREVLQRHGDRVIITPHAGEMARLTGIPKDEITADPLRIARDAAGHLHCIVVLKGASTVIAQPGGPLYLHEGGVTGLATSGSGDVLAGVLAGLLARGTAPLAAALWSVYLHAQAGLCLSDRIGPLGFLARELPAEIPALMHSLRP